MIIGGLQKFSLIDYPEKISAIIFTQGCNFRCPYCHNPELIKENESFCFNEQEVLSFLKRLGKLDAVVITGGEPTLQADIIAFLTKIKKLGYLIKLDSNGSNPEILEKIIKSKLVNYIAMDLKAPFEKLEKVVQAEINQDLIKKSVNLIINSGINHEFRTTIVKSLLEKEDFEEMGKILKGANLYALQKFIPSKTLNPLFMQEKIYTDEEFSIFKEILEKNVKKVVIR